MNPPHDVAHYLSTIADIELFADIFGYLDAHPDSSYQQIVEHVGKGLSPQKISTFIERLESQMKGGRLIDRKRRSKNNRLTPAARQAYLRGLGALKTFRTWLTPAAELIKIGAPNLLVHAVFPKILPVYRRGLAASEHNIDIRLIEQPDLETVIDSVVKGEMNFALTWIHEGNRDYINFVNKTPSIRATIDEAYFGVEFRILLICPPGHRFASPDGDAAPGSQPQPAREVDLAELADELVYVLPAKRQPLFGLIPPPNKPDDRVVQYTYMDIISRLRCHVKEGVGLVPSIYSDLNEMLRKGQLYYVPIKAEGVGEERLKMKIGCITREGVEKLSPPEKLFFEIARTKLAEISKIDHEPGVAMGRLPTAEADYPGFSHCCFVMQQNATFGVPHWFRGRLNLRPNGKKGLAGDFVADTANQYKFKVDEARLWKSEGGRNPIFQFVGIAEPVKSGPPHVNTIVCTFSMFVGDANPNNEAIVGVWSGRDDAGLATIAPMVLTRAELPIETIRLIVNRVSFRCLPNAESDVDPPSATP